MTRTVSHYIHREGFYSETSAFLKAVMINFFFYGQKFITLLSCRKHFFSSVVVLCLCKTGLQNLVCLRGEDLLISVGNALLQKWYSFIHQNQPGSMRSWQYLITVNKTIFLCSRQISVAQKCPISTCSQDSFLC